MPAGGLPPAAEEDIVQIEQWISDGCPEFASRLSDPGILFTAKSLGSHEISDEVHTEYWRAVDDFFLPGLASETTSIHVGRVHAAALMQWAAHFVSGQPESIWTNYILSSDVQDSATYVRNHQRRLLLEFYEGDQSAILESLWKFGGSLLPEDPLSNARPHHRMNSVLDWFFWVPHLFMTLAATDLDGIDIALARGWQIGIVADGLLRLDNERPVSKRMPIPDFDRSDPNLKDNVFNAFKNMSVNELRDGMIRRANDFDWTSV